MVPHNRLQATREMRAPEARSLRISRLPELSSRRTAAC